jgi:hypothetical protein
MGVAVDVTPVAMQNYKEVHNVIRF